MRADQTREKGGKAHGDRSQHPPKARATRGGRVARALAPPSPWWNNVPPPAVARAFVRGATGLDFRRFVYRSCHTANSPWDRFQPCLKLLLVVCGLNLLGRILHDVVTA